MAYGYNSHSIRKELSMYGTLTGNILAAAYYLYFQLTGLGLAYLLFRRESPLPRLVIGSVTGSLLLTWVPVLFSFCFDFTLLSHILALLVTLPLHIFLIHRLRIQGRHNLSASWPLSRKAFVKNIYLRRHLPFLALFFLFMAFWIYLLHTHTLLPDGTGALHTGQCTYGDMNMHLGFITSLAKQHSFPPDYSIMPGVRLSYPFLSDSISSSLYLLGASLRFAYILPMIFAMAHIFAAVYLFASALAQSQGRKQHSGIPLLTLLFFFCNGGLGFAFFLDWSRESAYSFSDIFTGFYTTPTNLVGHNIRWVNIIADMLLPQRATLFGYSLLFPALWLLYRAAFQDRREYFPISGFFLAALPMIHTHSFLSAGVICAVWLLLWLSERISPTRSGCSLGEHCHGEHCSDAYCPDEHRSGAYCPAALCPGKHRSGAYRPGAHRPGGWIPAFFTIILCTVQLLNSQSALSSQSLMLAGLSLFFIAVIWGCRLLYVYIRQNGWRELLTSWGVCLLCVLALALPQLFFWTFGQVAQGGFVRGHFNWGNQGDFYPWFYLKNIGLPLLLILGGICACNRKGAPLFLPAGLLWWLGEFIVFTPNTYDNNKLLYVAYFLLCLGAADYAVTLYDKIKHIPGCRFLSGTFLFFTALSGLLTLGREAVSDYQLYRTAQVKLAEYVEENTPPDGVFLTDTRHNNEIASLTGRNIVCGADTFLYFHGLDTTERKADLRLMYEAPLEHPDLFQKYGVSYVVISSFERSSYAVDEPAFRNNFTEIFSWGDTVLYEVPTFPSSSSTRYRQAEGCLLQNHASRRLSDPRPCRSLRRNAPQNPCHPR